MVGAGGRKYDSKRNLPHGRPTIQPSQTWSESLMADSWDVFITDSYFQNDFTV